MERAFAISIMEALPEKTYLNEDLRSSQGANHVEISGEKKSKGKAFEGGVCPAGWKITKPLILLGQSAR